MFLPDNSCSTMVSSWNYTFRGKLMNVNVVQKDRGFESTLRAER